MIKPNYFGHLTTGMFNLIVKDPRRIPPGRAALDQGSPRPEAARPRTCCAVMSARRLILPDNAQAALGELSKGIELLPGCQQESQFLADARIAAITARLGVHPTVASLPAFVDPRKPRTAKNLKYLSTSNADRGPKPFPRILSALNCLWIVRSGRSCLLGRFASVELPPLRLTSCSCGPGLISGRLADEAFCCCCQA